LGEESPMIEGAERDLRMGRIDLARAPDFELGSLRIRPLRCEAVLPDGVVRELEPRSCRCWSRSPRQPPRWCRGTG
jgi:hypothetical protein